MILKLKEAGDTHTMTIKACEEAKGQYGEQVKFDGTDGNTLFLPKESADRQLGRIPLTYDEAVGLTLTFSRDPNPKKGSSPYWGIKLADAGSKAPAPSGKRLTPEQAAHARPHTGPLPTQPFDEPTDEERFAEFDRAIDEVADPYLEHPALPNAKVPTLASNTERDYLALWDRVAKHQVEVGNRLGFPVDGSSIQAATFSIFKASGH